MQIYAGNIQQIRGENKPVQTGYPLATGRTVADQSTAGQAGETDFQSVLQSNLTKEVQFSRHANTRLNSREISLSTDQLKRVEGAIAKAGEKGIKDSLVLVDDLALVVNVKNKLVITAMNRGNNVFTNIDGAVIA